MSRKDGRITILMADDDSDDFYLTRDALQECGIVSDFRQLMDGEELIDYLMNRGPYSDIEKNPKPGLILLDLNMPRKDGREALGEIKGNPEMREIPVIVLTTSGDDEDIRRCYELGANSYITKPQTFSALVRVVESLVRYWIDTVELPSRRFLP